MIEEKKKLINEQEMEEVIEEKNHEQKWEFFLIPLLCVVFIYLFI